MFDPSLLRLLTLMAFPRDADQREAEAVLTASAMENARHEAEGSFSPWMLSVLGLNGSDRQSKALDDLARAEAAHEALGGMRSVLAAKPISTIVINMVKAVPAGLAVGALMVNVRRIQSHNRQWASQNRAMHLMERLEPARGVERTLQRYWKPLQPTAHLWAAARVVLDSDVSDSALRETLTDQERLISLLVAARTRSIFLQHASWFSAWACKHKAAGSNTPLLSSPVICWDKGTIPVEPTLQPLAPHELTILASYETPAFFKDDLPGPAKRRK